MGEDTGGLQLGMLLMLLSIIPTSLAVSKVQCYPSRFGSPTIYNFTLMDIHKQEEVPLAKFKDKVVLIVNVASFWGVTHHYIPMNALQSQFADLEVIGIPCNLFGLVRAAHIFIANKYNFLINSCCKCQMWSACLLSGKSFLKLLHWCFKQEPGANGTEIMNSLKYVRPGNGFVPNFTMLEKVEVNGINEHPLYTYLKVWNYS